MKRHLLGSDDVLRHIKRTSLSISTLCGTPHSFMMDGSEAQRNAVEQLFPHLYIIWYASIDVSSSSYVLPHLLWF